MSVKKELASLANPSKARVLQGFFKTGPGQYGEGDEFLGVTVPQSRAVAKKFIEADFSEIKLLLGSKIHEERLVALLILVEKFKKGDGARQKEVFDFFMQNRARANNWDLVDLSADKIAGEHLFSRDKSVLFELAKSSHIWDKRIAIVSTFAFIKKGRFKETFALVEQLLADKHDLIQKACGWMLREAGKRDLAALDAFLKKNHEKMPRTMLRYAIEKFPAKKRRDFLNGTA